MAGVLISDYAVDTDKWAEMVETQEKQRKGFIGLSLTNYDNSSLPAIEAASYLECVGALYGFSSEEAIGGSPTTANINYIVFDPTPITFSWSITPPTWSPSKNGWYDAGEAKRYVGGCHYVDTPVYTDKWIYRRPEDCRHTRANGSLRPLATKSLEIGVWDMVANDLKNVAHGIANYRKIRTVTILIYNETNDWYNIWESHGIAADEVLLHYVIIDATNVKMYINADSFFHTEAYDSTAVNRGSITIEYED